MADITESVLGRLIEAQERGRIQGLKEALEICRSSDVVCANEAVGQLEAIIGRVEDRRGN